jgi:ELWxxDGT repeat protein
VLVVSATIGLAGPDVSAASAASFTASEVANLQTAAAGDHARNLTAVGSETFFTAYEPGFGNELWKSDGTAGGTVMVDDIQPGSAGSYPRT